MDKSDIDKIWLQVKENSKKLEGCALHDFSIDTTPEKPMLKKYRCSKCGGVVDGITKSWYEKGLAHAKAQKG